MEYWRIPVSSLVLRHQWTAWSWSMSVTLLSTCTFVDLSCCTAQRPDIRSQWRHRSPSFVDRPCPRRPHMPLVPRRVRQSTFSNMLRLLISMKRTIYNITPRNSRSVMNKKIVRSWEISLTDKHYNSMICVVVWHSYDNTICTCHQDFTINFATLLTLTINRGRLPFHGRLEQLVWFHWLDSETVLTTCRRSTTGNGRCLCC